jgi:hypothetical protein
LSYKRHIYTKIGDPEHFIRQKEIYFEYNIPLVGPVYKSYRPSNIIRPSANLKPISRLDLLRETLPFFDVHQLVTVRQVYYNLVSRQIIFNNANEYERISDLLVNTRLAGLVSFDQVIDETREPMISSTWGSIEEIIKAAIQQYRSEWWSDQDNYVEIWLEKRALNRIFFPITDVVGVPLCVGGGYQSWSEVYNASKRFDQHLDKKCFILYFGDLDPSGKDMPRDIQSRFSTLGVPVEVVEIALTIDDVTRYNLPRNPTERRRGRSRADPRREWYINRYGIEYGVELDALPPEVLEEKIRESISRYVNIKLIFKNKEKDEKEKDFWNHIVDSVIESHS